MRRAWTRPAVAALSLVAVALTAGCGSNGSDERVTRIPAPGFVERLAPLVHTHPRESASAVAADDFIDSSQLVWVDGKGGRTTVASDPSPARLGDTDTGIAYTRKIGPRAGCPTCTTLTVESSDDARPFEPERDEEELRDGEGYVLDVDGGGVPEARRAPVYTEVIEEDYRGKHAFYVTYWMLFDGAAAGREGDWQRIAVVLRPAKRNASYEPLVVRYYDDDRHRDVTWESAEVAEGGPGEPARTHPVVYLGRGDHKPSPAAPADAGENCDGCPRWRTWEHLINADTQPWYRYGGAWGDVGTGPDDTGPQGPSFFVER